MSVKSYEYKKRRAERALERKRHKSKVTRERRRLIDRTLGDLTPRPVAKKLRRDLYEEYANKLGVSRAEAKHLAFGHLYGMGNGMSKQKLNSILFGSPKGPGTPFMSVDYGQLELRALALMGLPKGGLDGTSEAQAEKDTSLLCEEGAQADHQGDSGCFDAKTV